MVQTIKLDVDSLKCEVQKGFSFVQQQEIMNIIEEYIDLSKLRQLQEKLEPNEVMNLDHASQVIREGKKLMEFNFELSKYCLLNFMVKPKITEADLKDPDNPDSDNYAVLGLELSELALAHISKKALLKKTPTE